MERETQRQSANGLELGRLREAAAADAQGDRDLALITPAHAGSHSLTASLRSSGVGAYTWNRNRDLVFWQGYPHPALGLSGTRQNPLSVFLNSLHPDDVDRVLETVERSTREGRKWEMRYRVHWPDGSLHWIVDRGEPTFDADGGIEGFSGVCLEVSGQVETEQALVRQRSFLRLVLDLNPNIIFAKDRDGRFTLANRSLADFHGTTAEDLIGKTSSDLNLSSAESARLAAQDRRVIDERIEYRSPEEQWTDAKGKRRWLQTTMLPLVDQDGSCDQLVGIAVDTTEHKQSELALAKQRAFLHQVVDSIPSLIFAKDRSGRFTLANRAVAELYGTTADAMIGKTDADFHDNVDEVDGYLADDAVVLARAAPVFVGEEQCTTAEGNTRWFHTVKVPLRNESGRIDQILGVATETTEQKHAREARERLEESLRQSQKMESIGHLAAGIAHDFNNLLTPILGYAELGLDALPEGHPVREDLAAVTAAAESASALVQQLLAFGRKQMLEIQELDLNHELEYMTRILRRVIPEHICIDLVLDANLEGVRADPTQLQQILLNLAVNARDAMPMGGNLSIRSARACGPQDQTTPGVMITVRDTGCGMSAGVMERAFEPFFTTKERGSRVGLGLSTVYGIAEQHGGSVGVESEPGSGTQFSIWLPSSGAPPAPVVRPVPSKRGGEITGSVLVVEDDPGVRSFVCRALGDRGFQVHAAESGEEALELARKSEFSIDLLLTDIIMPGTDGRALFAQISELRPDTQVLYMSGYAEDAIDPRASEGVANRLLRKPFAAETLLERVAAVLR